MLSSSMLRQTATADCTFFETRRTTHFTAIALGRQRKLEARTKTARRDRPGQRHPSRGSLVRRLLGRLCSHRRPWWPIEARFDSALGVHRSTRRLLVATESIFSIPKTALTRCRGAEQRDDGKPAFERGAQNSREKSRERYRGAASKRGCFATSKRGRAIPTSSGKGASE